MSSSLSICHFPRTSSHNPSTERYHCRYYCNFLIGSTGGVLFAAADFGSATSRTPDKGLQAELRRRDYRFLPAPRSCLSRSERISSFARFSSTWSVIVKVFIHFGRFDVDDDATQESFERRYVVKIDAIGGSISSPRRQTRRRYLRLHGRHLRRMHRRRRFRFAHGAHLLRPRY